MKVKELIATLQDLDPEAEVIMQADSEGNGYSPCDGATGDTVYIADSSYSGEVYTTSWTAEEAGMEEDEWTEILSNPRCVVLYPVN